jgi:hypothetical protein
MLKFDDLSAIQNLKTEAYIFIDSNIDLLKINQANAAIYFNLIIEKSFFQGIAKATRMKNNSPSLIDHILFNVNCTKFISGTIVSDRFLTFIIPPNRSKTTSTVHKSVTSRNYSLQNLNNFKRELAGSDWATVLTCQNVDAAYEIFWNNYSDCHNRNFPLTRKRFNKNIHKRHHFMTAGLLVSRNNKNNLNKQAIVNARPDNIQRYKNFKTVYFCVLRAAKKLHFTNKINSNIGNSKKTWETLNEILGKSKNNNTINQLNINDMPESDPTKIANHFNAFFTSIGTKILNNVLNVDKQPEEYCISIMVESSPKWYWETPRTCVTNYSKIKKQI